MSLETDKNLTTYHNSQKGHNSLWTVEIRTHVMLEVYMYIYQYLTNEKAVSLPFLFHILLWKLACPLQLGLSTFDRWSFRSPTASDPGCRSSLSPTRCGCTSCKASGACRVVWVASGCASHENPWGWNNEISLDLQNTWILLLFLNS